MLHKKPWLWIASAILICTTSTFAGSVNIFPVRVELERRAAFIHISNVGDDVVEYTIQKGADWMVVGPSRLTIQPGATGRFKVGRLIDRDTVEQVGTVSLNAANGNVITLTVRVPAK